MKEIGVVLSEQLEFENSDKSAKLFLDVQELDTWIKRSGFLIKSTSTSLKISIEDLMGEIKPVVAEFRV